MPYFTGLVNIPGQRQKYVQLCVCKMFYTTTDKDQAAFVQVWSRFRYSAKWLRLGNFTFTPCYDGCPTDDMSWVRRGGDEYFTFSKLDTSKAKKRKYEHSPLEFSGV